MKISPRISNSSGKSPFNFKEKQQIAQAHGIDASKVLPARVPYVNASYTQFDQDEVSVIFAVGEKDYQESLNRAKIVQNGILPTIEKMKDMFQEHFLYYSPLQTISGDFYWMKENKSKTKVFFSVADCTGHGVPGAFMSMIGTSLLNEIIVEKGIKDTNKILDEMRSQIIKSLNQDTQDDQKDGMDISIAVVDSTKNSLEFAGAKNPLVYMHKKRQRGGEDPVHFHNT